MPKTIGRDSELSTTGIDPDGQAIDNYDVACAILDEIGPVFASRDLRIWQPGGVSPGEVTGRVLGGGAGSRDALRRWAANGQCFYCDLGHVELCTAETTRPREFAAQTFAALRIAEEARARAEERAPDGTRLLLTTANVDVAQPAISWGTHVNVALASGTWEDLLGEARDPGVRAYVAGALAAAVPFFGAGYLLPDPEGVVYSLSARALHIGRLVSQSTTESFARGLLNARREPHAGAGIDRLHLIAFDHAPASSALLATYLQCVLAAAELGVYRGPFLRRPLEALWAWSIQLDPARPALVRPWPTSDGRQRTLPGFVRAVVEPLLQLLEEGVLTEDVVPEAAELLPHVLELCRYLEEGSFLRCAPYLDWALKMFTLMDVCERHGMELGDELTPALDHDFGNTNPAVGPFLELWEAGHVEAFVSHADVERFLRTPPEESRAWARGRLIQRFCDEISDMDWEFVELRRASARWAARTRIHLDDPHGHGRVALEYALERSRSTDDVLRSLRATDPGLIGESDPIAGVRRRLRRSATIED